MNKAEFAATFLAAVLVEKAGGRVVLKANDMLDVVGKMLHREDQPGGSVVFTLEDVEVIDEDVEG